MIRFNPNVMRYSMAILSVVALLVGLVPSAALASGPIDASEPSLAGKVDDRLDPLTVEQWALRQQALEDVLRGAPMA